jgi:uncharacterized membrane protein YhaH (DUF805 family)
MITHYVSAILNSFNFEGRMDRRAYWYFMLAATMLSLLAFAADTTLIMDALSNGQSLPSLDQIGGAAKFVALAHALPLLSANVRRLRDAGKPGVSILIVLVPVIGQLTLFSWLMQPSVKTSEPTGRGGLGRKSTQTSNWSQRIGETY